MNTFIQLLTVAGLGHDFFILALVICGGLALGALQFRGICLGVAGVLFSGLLFGHFGLNISETSLNFARELGLILFVFTIGLQVGPGFFQSLKAQGLKLNLLALTAVLTGSAIAFFYIISGILPSSAAVGLLCGASTNTPSLGAVQAALGLLHGVDAQTLNVPAMAYAMAYPFGILGLLLSMLAIRFFFRLDPEQEAKKFELQAQKKVEQISSLNLVVENSNLNQIAIHQIPFLKEKGLVISRILHEEKLYVAGQNSILHIDDIIHIVGPKQHLKQAQILFGSVSAIDLRLDVENKNISSKRIIVTRKNLVGQTVAEVSLSCLAPVAITRIIRSGIELPVTSDMQLEFADTVVAVGEQEALANLEQAIGNSEKALNIPELIPVFLGIAIGLFIGSIPFTVPGLPYPIRLGLAAGPLISAIVLSRIGRIGRVIWYMPHGANLFVREFGVALFLACVGIKSGGQFVEMLLQGPGLKWMMLGSVITIVPLVVAAFIGTFLMKVNFLSLCGLLSATMTSPPGLAFANSQSSSNAPSVGYAAVYPMVMILRIMIVQFLILFFC